MTLEIRQGAFPKLAEEDKLVFTKEVTIEEVREAIFSMGSFKAPGADGFQAVFYKSQWEIVGKDLFNLVKLCFNQQSRIEEINDTLITLIPKADHVTTIKQFRLISLCNVSYKVITKILAIRLKTVMEKLIHPCQCSFIPNRNSGDNIIIAQEIIHSMKSKKRSRPWMAIKIDLEKAYDRMK